MTDTLEIDGLTFGVVLEPDADAGAPWDNMETFGAVHCERTRLNDWPGRVHKAPGEITLNVDGYHVWLYDFAGAVAKARREGYSGVEAVEAVERECRLFRAWFRDEWQYVGVVVTLLDTEGNPTDESDALWGVDDDGDYAKTCAYDMALGIHTRVGSLDVLVTETRIRN